jgi:hypothetical protein
VTMSMWLLEEHDASSPHPDLCDEAILSVLEEKPFSSVRQTAGFTSPSYAAICRGMTKSLWLTARRLRHVTHRRRTHNPNGRCDLSDAQPRSPARIVASQTPENTGEQA